MSPRYGAFAEDQGDEEQQHADDRARDVQVKDLSDDFADQLIGQQQRDCTGGPIGRRQEHGGPADSALLGRGARLRAGGRRGRAKDDTGHADAFLEGMRSPVLLL